MTFEDLKLSKSLLNAINDIGYVNPTPIQRESFSPILSGRDIVGVAQTGTGKTWAYLLPILRDLKFSKDKLPRAIVIVPTRELVLQVVTEIEKLTEYMTVRVAGVYGGTNINTQKTTLYQGHDIVVGTPGRMMDLAMIKSLNLRAVKQVVIDEMDVMMNEGFRVQLTNIFDMLPKKRQHILFSATMSSEIETVIDQFFETPHKIVIARHGAPLEKIVQSHYRVPNFNTKANLLKLLIANDDSLGKVLVFMKSKRYADLLFERLNEAELEGVGVIHGNKSQNYRNKSVADFESGDITYLIATDVIARGIDVSDITHVINFDMPEDADIYIHRIGRTGRADKDGTAISFVADYEEGYLMAIEELMGMTVPVIESPEDLVAVTKMLPDEVPQLAGDKHYLKNVQMDGQGAFHEKKLKNQKTNIRRPRKPKPQIRSKRRG